MQRKVVECSLEQLAPAIEEILKEEMSFTIRVTGNSMLPLWRDKRDLVTLEACDEESLHKRDIVLYRRANGQYVLHRILCIRGERLTLCGDAQTKVEREIPVSAVIARVVGICRNGRWISCQQWLYRCYSWSWCAVRPIRGVLLKAGGKCRRLIGKR